MNRKFSKKLMPENFTSNGGQAYQSLTGMTSNISKR